MGRITTRGSARVGSGQDDPARSEPTRDIGKLSDSARPGPARPDL